MNRRTVISAVIMKRAWQTFVENDGLLVLAVCIGLFFIFFVLAGGLN